MLLTKTIASLLEMALLKVLKQQALKMFALLKQMDQKLLLLNELI